ncbi:MAG TPA: twin-arginine translocase subunit TatC [Burkholderiales bacterium]|nr:twin-arginine translocase subunit TatC [Burkholderiales bacterium]
MALTEDTFISHLVELRDRLLRALIAIVVAFALIGFWPTYGVIYDFLALPLIQTLPAGSKMIATGVITPFLIPLKVGLMAAFMLVLPYVLYQAWAFVAPGLYSYEKKLVLPLVVSSTVLFIVGVAFCYYFVFGQLFRFIAGFAPASITPAPDIEQYLSFVLTMFLAFGVAFEVPVAIIVLVRMGVVSIQQLRDFRGYFVVCASIAAAVVTPPDVVSMLALLIPMCLLYEAGIIAASFISSVKAPEAAAETSESTAVSVNASVPLTPEQAAQEFAAVEKEQNSNGR